MQENSVPSDLPRQDPQSPVSYASARHNVGLFDGYSGPTPPLNEREAEMNGKIPNDFHVRTCDRGVGVTRHHLCGVFKSL
jgi:hypothetical protein